jgi:hypothetical protein
MPLTAINIFKNDIKRFNRQKKYWLLLSFFIAIVISTIILFWNFLLKLHSAFVWWSIGIGGLITTIIWWWWTMFLINKIIWHQSQVIEILNDISKDIDYVKKEVLYLKPN